MVNRKEFTILFLIYSIFVLTKTILSFQVPYPIYLRDERKYLEMGESFLKTGKFLFEGKIAHHYPPLYPVFISPATFFDITLASPLIKIINSFISSLIIFPVYIISREFLNREKALFVGIFSSLVPENFVYSFNIVSENLFYPLFMVSMYFMARSFTENNKKWDILCGIFIGLSILTRMIGLVLLLALLIGLFIKVFMKNHRKKKLIIIKTFFSKIFRKWRLFLILFLVILPWFVRNVYYFGFSSYGLTGYTEFETKYVTTLLSPSVTTSLQYIQFVLMHTGFVIFASGILFFVFSILVVINFKKCKGFFYNFVLISWISFVILVLLGGYWSFTGKVPGEKLMGRYVAFIIPSFLIMGWVGKKFCKNNKGFLILLIISSILLLFLPIDERTSSFDTLSTLILHAPGYLYKLGIIFPISNVVIKTFMILTPFIFLLLKKEFGWKYIIPLFLVFFITSSTAASIAIHIASYDAQEYMDFALWVRSNIPKESIILFDKRSGDSKEEMGWMIEGMKFWTENKILIGDVNKIKEFDFVFSTRKLNLPLVRTLEAEEGILNLKTEIIFFYSSVK